VADEDLHELDELGDKENERENEESKKGVTRDFASDIAVEETHERKGECNMGEEGNEARRRRASEKRTELGRSRREQVRSCFELLRVAATDWGESRDESDQFGGAVAYAPAAI
jgi:hypothetical protein